jgi:hypothetical protein
VKLNFSMLTSKTIWGTVIALVGYLLQPNVLAVLPEKVAGIITAIGGLLAAVGIRAAIAGNGPSVTPAESAKANGLQ